MTEKDMLTSQIIDQIDALRVKAGGENANSVQVIANVTAKVLRCMIGIAAIRDGANIAILSVLTLAVEMTEDELRRVLRYAQDLEDLYATSDDIEADEARRSEAAQAE